MLAVLHVDPMLRPTGQIRTVPTLGDQSLVPKAARKRSGPISPQGTKALAATLEERETALTVTN